MRQVDGLGPPREASKSASGGRDSSSSRGAVTSCPLPQARAETAQTIAATASRLSRRAAAAASPAASSASTSSARESAETKSGAVAAACTRPCCTSQSAIWSCPKAIANRSANRTAAIAPELTSTRRAARGSPASTRCAPAAAARAISSVAGPTSFSGYRNSAKPGMRCDASHSIGVAGPSAASRNNAAPARRPGPPNAARTSTGTPRAMEPANATCGSPEKYSEYGVSEAPGPVSSGASSNAQGKARPGKRRASSAKTPTARSSRRESPRRRRSAAGSVAGADSRTPQAPHSASRARVRGAARAPAPSIAQLPATIPASSMLCGSPASPQLPSTAPATSRRGAEGASTKRRTAQTASGRVAWPSANGRLLAAIAHKNPEPDQVVAAIDAAHGCAPSRRASRKAPIAASGSAMRWFSLKASGGVGGYYGARLQQAGHQVAFVARGAHAEAMRKSGLRIRSELGDAELRVRVVDDPAQAGPADLVVVAVKLWDTEDAARAAARVPGAAAVSLQNGVDKDEVLAGAIGRERVLGGVTHIGAVIAEPGTVTHTGRLQRD